MPRNARNIWRSGRSRGPGGDRICQWPTDFVRPAVVDSRTMSPARPPRRFTHGDILRWRRVGGLVLAEVAYAPAARIPAHTHPNARFVLVLEGTIGERMEDVTAAHHAGALLFRRAHQPHAYTVGPAGATALIVDLAPEWIERAEQHARVLEQSAVFARGFVLHLAHRLHGEFRLRDEVSRLAIESITLGVLAEASRRVARRRAAPGAGLAAAGARAGRRPLCRSRCRWSKVARRWSACIPCTWRAPSVASTSIDVRRLRAPRPHRVRAPRARRLGRAARRHRGRRRLLRSEPLLPPVQALHRARRRPNTGWRCRRAKPVPSRSFVCKTRARAVRLMLAPMGLFSKKSIADLQAEADGGLLRRSLGPLEPDRARHRLDHRHRHLRADRHGGVAERRAGARALDDHLRRRLRVLGPLLRRVRGDGAGGRQRLHLRVRDDRRVRRLDHRLGPDPRVRAQRRDGGRRLVRLLRELRSRCRRARSRRALASPPPDGRLQPAGGASSCSSSRRCWSSASSSRPTRTRCWWSIKSMVLVVFVVAGACVREAREPDAVHPAEHGGVRVSSAGAACCAAPA